MTIKTDDKPSTFEEYRRKLEFDKSTSILPGALEEYHRQQAGKPALTVIEGGLKSYEAYRSQDRLVGRLEIRSVLAEDRAPHNRFLIDVASDGVYGTEIVLYYTITMVRIAGKNLQAVARAIREHKCLFIQDFHPKEFILPETKAPLITSITFDTGKPVFEPISKP